MTTREDELCALVDRLHPLGHRPHRRLTGASVLTGGHVQKTPLEQAIAQTDRRGRYEAKMRREGFARCTLWIRAECADDLKLLAKLLNGTNGKLRDDLSALVGRAKGAAK